MRGGNERGDVSPPDPKPSMQLRKKLDELPYQQRRLACADLLQEAPTPKTQGEVRQLVGLLGYYRKVVPQYKSLIAPLVSLCWKGEEYSWDTQTQASVDAMVQLILAHRDQQKQLRNGRK